MMCHGFVLFWWLSAEVNAHLSNVDSLIFSKECFTIRRGYIFSFE